MKNIIIFTALILCFYTLSLFADTISPYPAEILYKKSKVDESETTNTIHRISQSRGLRPQFETIMYRGKVAGDEISDFVKFNISDLSYEEMCDYDEYGPELCLYIKDPCVKEGSYFYISDLNCDEYSDDFKAGSCRNYAEIVYKASLNDDCDPELYEAVELTKDDIESMKSQSKEGRGRLFPDRNKIDFGEVRVGDHADQYLTISNNSNRFSAADSFRDCPEFTIIVNGDDNSCSSYVSLESGDSCVMTIRFTPSEDKEYFVSFNSSSEDFEVALRGQGVLRYSDDNETKMMTALIMTQLILMVVVL